MKFCVEMKYSFVILLSLLIVFSSSALFSQNSIGGNETRGMDMNTYPYGTIAEIGFISSKTIGSYYLNDNWLIGSIKLTSGEDISDYPLKLDLENNYVEIKTDKGIKILQGRRVKNFSWFDGVSTREFININEVDSKEAHSDGFLQILETGDDWSLYKKYSTKLVEGNYIAALDAGNPNNKIVKNEDYLLSNTEQVFELPKSKKKFASLFAGKEEEVLDYIKENRINLKDEKDLIKLIEFVNQ